MGEKTEFPVSGVAIAVLASDDFSVLNGTDIREAFGSTWTVLLVTAKWYSQISREVSDPGRINMQILIPEGLDPQIGAKFAQEASIAAAREELIVPDFDAENINQILHILLQIASRYLGAYVRLAGISYDEGIEKLRQNYVDMLASGFQK